MMSSFDDQQNSLSSSLLSVPHSGASNCENESLIDEPSSFVIDQDDTIFTGDHNKSTSSVLDESSFQVADKTELFSEEDSKDEIVDQQNRSLSLSSSSIQRSEEPEINSKNVSSFDEHVSVTETHYNQISSHLFSHISFFVALFCRFTLQN